MPAFGMKLPGGRGIIINIIAVRRAADGAARNARAHHAGGGALDVIPRVEVLAIKPEPHIHVTPQAEKISPFVGFTPHELVVRAAPPKNKEEGSAERLQCAHGAPPLSFFNYTIAKEQSQSSSREVVRLYNFAVTYRIFAAFFLFFLWPSLALGATLSAGFVGEALWFSREQFFTGETVRLLTALRNSSSEPLEGEVVFSDKGKEVGKADASLSKESAEIISFSWIATEGEHEFRAEFKSKDANVMLQAPRTAVRGAIVDSDTDHDGIGDKADTDDDGDGIPDVKDATPLKAEEAATSSVIKVALSEGKAFLETHAPSVESLGEKVFNKTEQLRTKLSAITNAARDDVAQDIKEEEAKEKKDSEERRGWQRAFQTGELLALSLAGAVFDSRLLFYPLALLLLGWILWKGTRWIRRIRSGRRW